MGKAYFCGNFRAVVWGFIRRFIRIITRSIKRNIILIRHSGACRGIRRSVKNIMRLRLDPQGFAQDDKDGIVRSARGILTLALLAQDDGEKTESARGFNVLLQQN